MGGSRCAVSIRGLLSLAVAVLVAGQTDPDARSQDATVLYQQTLPAVMTLTAEHADGSTIQGSAFLAIGDGLAVTAWHVVRGARKLTARFADGTEVPVVGLVDHSEPFDLALVRITASLQGRPVLRVDPHEPMVGTRVFTIGAPEGFDFTLSDGLVSQIRRTNSGEAFVQFSAPASPGSSGGPLLLASGVVVGVTDQQVLEGQNLNLAVSTEHLAVLNASHVVQPWQSIADIAGPTAKPQPLRLSDLTGTYIGTWSSGRAPASGAAVLEITVTGESVTGSAHLTGSPIGYGGDDVVFTPTKAGDGVWYVSFQGKTSRLSGTGIFHRDAFVGDYRYVRVMAGIDDRGQWVLKKTSSGPVSSR